MEQSARVRMTSINNSTDMTNLANTSKGFLQNNSNNNIAP